MATQIFSELSPLLVPGERIQFDYIIFSDGLKPTTNEFCNLTVPHHSPLTPRPGCTKGRQHLWRPHSEPGALRKGNSCVVGFLFKTTGGSVQEKGIYIPPKFTLPGKRTAGPPENPCSWFRCIFWLKMLTFLGDVLVFGGVRWNLKRKAPSLEKEKTSQKTISFGGWFLRC